MRTPETVVEDYTYRLLLYSTANEYASRITELIYKDVIEDLCVCADENWNDDDIRFAIGRVLCKKIGIEY